MIVLVMYKVRNKHVINEKRKNNEMRIDISNEQHLIGNPHYF